VETGQVNTMWMSHERRSTRGAGANTINNNITYVEKMNRRVEI
jgi:hypothetical protein